MSKTANKKGITQGAMTAFSGFTSADAVQGNIMHIASEVLVSNALRWMMKRPTNFMDATETHVYASYLLGGVDFSDVKEPAVLAKGDTSGKLINGAQKGFNEIPAAISGYIAKEIRKNGLKIPSILNNEVFYLIAGKILSAPIYSYVLDSLPKGSQEAAAVFNALIRKRKDQAKA